MTRLGVIADVHADVHALEEALARMDRLACDRVVCAGDLVGYGLFPEEVIALLRDRGVVCVRGNHDRWAVGDETPEDWAAGGQNGGHDASGWDLSREALRFLKKLPRGWHDRIEGVRVAMVHGTPLSEMDGVYDDHVTAAWLERWLELADADVLIVGHTHEPLCLAAPSGGIVVNPGVLHRPAAVDAEPAVQLFNAGQQRFVPCPRPPAGTFGILELPSRKFGVYLAADGSEVEVPRARGRAGR